MARMVCVDVDYRAAGAVAAAVVFERWDAAAGVEEVVRSIAAVEPYLPGQFYRRELPCLQAVLGALAAVDLVVIDGYVWLAPGRPGLGAHLHGALGGGVPVIGVAKSRFASATPVEVKRGTSVSPLFVTAEGIDPGEAARHVQSMHGPYRVPTLLKRVDQLCRRA
jgi:deoxyribonuclease V